jgi:hypothetical protein
MIDSNKIDLGSLADELVRYENQWVALSEDSQIVASGPTYSETVNRVERKDSVVLLKVPPLDASLAPSIE